MTSVTGPAEVCTEHIIHPDRVKAAARAMPDQEMTDRMAQLFTALGHPSRLRIVQALSAQELCVCDLAAVLGSSESAVSHQLRHLRALRLIRPRREGKLVYYRLDDEHVHQLIDTTLTHLEE